MYGGSPLFLYNEFRRMAINQANPEIASGTFDSYVADFEKIEYDDELLTELREKLVQAKERVVEVIQFVKEQSTSYLDLSGARLVDSAIAIICGHLLLGQGAKDERKRRVARRFIESQLPVLRMNCEQTLSGDSSAMDEYQLLAGPVPASDV